MTTFESSVGAPLNLPASRVIGDDGDTSPRARYASRPGSIWSSCERIHCAIGLPRIEDPDAPDLSRADGEAAAQARIILDLGIDPEDVVAVLRVMKESLGHAAAVMREAALKTILKPGATEIEVAEAIEALALRAAPTFGPMMEALLRLELRRTFETEAVTAAERAAGILPGARQITVCFADLTGFTRLGEAIPPEDLERVANRLAELAHDVSPAPVRFVKSIGDAVMLVCSDPVPLVDAVLDLADATAAHDLPRAQNRRRIRAAPSAGPVTGSAVPSTWRAVSPPRRNLGRCLSPSPPRDAIGNAGDYEWSPIGARHLKGVSGDVKLFRVRRAATA